MVVVSVLPRSIRVAVIVVSISVAPGCPVARGGSRRAVRSSPPNAGGTGRPSRRRRAAGPARSRRGRHCACRPCSMRPARSSTRRCLEMRGLAHVEGRGQVLDRRLALGEPGEDRPPGRVGEGGERGAEGVGLLHRHHHWLYNLVVLYQLRTLCQPPKFRGHVRGANGRPSTRIAVSAPAKSAGLARPELAVAGVAEARA